MNKHTVILPTAGLGTRMGDYTKHLNKGLLPYKEKPVIAHIIDQFPIDTHFVMPVGYLADQIKDFCAVAYSDRNITFVDVDWESNKAGTGYSLLQCKDYINSSFWYVTCDTFFNEPVVTNTPTHDCYYVKDIPQKDSHLYTMFKTNNNIIQEITFKKDAPSDWTAWTGLMYISEWENFFAKLTELNDNEFIQLIQPGTICKTLNSWLDFGSPTLYQTAVAKSQKFDFSKTNEVTYICNNRVVKWWHDSTVSKKKNCKPELNPKVFPSNCLVRGQFMAYDFFPGQTLYSFNNPVIFKELLNWLDDNVWTTVDCDLSQSAMLFYKDKTLARIEKFLDKYPVLQNITHVNNTKVKPYLEYLDNINWQYLSTNTLPGFIHGDLQFDNIIVNNSGDFLLIDWRHDFADVVDYGDIYYDLAKIAGGFIINYASIKQHNFDIEIQGTEVTLSVPNIDEINTYQQILKEFVYSKGWDYKKVQQLIPIIFWNMSPLHTAPFDMFLWYLGIKLFEDLENDHY
tara:strand:+ start:5603 stop:7138 length:1536 start_codon:yes stop_codon:yes gene_type:complete